ncbi:MAG: hypothetical protein KDA24_01710 [Deltaproteobacteria bacterium]|nr:hypothetical protein [Deltaproteobacteria bacterium]
MTEQPRLRRLAFAVVTVAGALLLGLVLAELTCRFVPLVHDKSLIRYRAVSGDEGQVPVADQSTPTLLGLVESTNSLGLRDPERPLDRAASSRRIALVGDSVVWGFGLADDELIGRRIERRLREKDPQRTWEVWSLAQPAATQVNHAARYERLGPQLDADAVLITVLFNDLLPGATRFRVTDGGMLASLHRDAPYPDALRPVLDRSALFHLTMMAVYAREKRNQADTHAFDMQHLPDLLGGLDRTVAAARAHGAKVAVVLVPGRYETPDGYAQLRASLTEWAAPKWLSVVDLADDLGSPLREELVLPGDSTHPNARGADLVAQRLATEAHALLR